VKDNQAVSSGGCMLTEVEVKSRLVVVEVNKS